MKTRNKAKEEIGEKFYGAWAWLQNFQDDGWPIYELTIDIVKVDPITKRIEDDESRNTMINYWLECGKPELDKKLGWIHVHDPDLDCGADSFEEAIIKLQKLIEKFYLNTHK